MYCLARVVPHGPSLYLYNFSKAGDTRVETAYNHSNSAETRGLWVHHRKVEKKTDYSISDLVTWPISDFHWNTSLERYFID